jgi:hypothetical protein
MKIEEVIRRRELRKLEGGRRRYEGKRKPDEPT